MTRYQFEIAELQDDIEFRKILNNTIIPGFVSVTFRKNPSYFQAIQIQGKFAQIIKGLDTKNNTITGFGARFIYPAFINGAVKNIGYLSDLRVKKKFRSRIILAKAYQYLNKLHTQNPVPFYTTMILDDNHKAIKILTSKRANLPTYKPLGKVLSPAIYLDFKKKHITLSSVTLSKGSKNNINSVFEFINKEHANKQFSPYYSINDLHTGRLKNLKEDDFYLAIKNNEIVGVIAAWDQQSFRQTHVEKYSKWLNLVRPFYNLLSKITPINPLPDIGEKIPYFYLSLIATKKNNVEIFSFLLRELYIDRRQKNWHYFICGLHESDPLTSALNEYRKINAYGNLYGVYFSSDGEPMKDIDNKVPYVEIATI